MQLIRTKMNNDLYLFVHENDKHSEAMRAKLRCRLAPPAESREPLCLRRKSSLTMYIWVI